MKRIFNFIAMLVLMAFVAKAQAELSIDNFKIEPGQSKEITIDMTSSEENIVTVGAIITLPEGLSFEKVYNRNRSYIELTDRKDDHNVTANILADGSLKFLATSLTLAPFFETSGALLKITVKADENIYPGNYTYSLKNVEITSETEEFTQALVEANVDVLKAVTPVTVSVSVNDESYGTVEGAGVFNIGTEVTIKAENAEGYHFEKWSNDVTDNPYTFIVEGDMDLTAEFAPNEYTVTFIDGEDTVEASKMAYGATIVAPKDPEKEGYTFSGWFNGDALFVEGSTVPIGDITYSAKYTVNSYKLTFTIDGQTISEADVEYGSAVTSPEAPEKEGYTFEGWTGIPEAMPATDVTVTGKYTVNSYKLTFTIDGQTVSEAEVEYGSSVTAPEAPEKEGYTFEGWTGIPEAMPATDVTVSGKYTVNSYKLTFTIDGQTISEADVEYGSAVTSPEAPEKEGYTFEGWTGIPEAMPATDVTVTGKYTVNSYKLTFTIDGQTVSEAEVEYGSSVTAPEAPEKEGYTFDGWTGLPETMPATDVTVTGKYTVNSYKLTFTIDGQTISEADVEYGSVVTVPEAPEKEGYTFDGWTGLLETMPANDVTVTGKYAVNSYKLTFAIDGQAISEAEVEYGSAVTAPEAPEKEGYTFDGWTGMPETMPANDVTVTGKYTVNSYKLTFVLDGQTVSEADVEYGSVVTAPEAPEKEGYTFDGWTALPETMPANDVTVTGKYTVNSYTLTFTIDGQTISEAEVEYGSAVTSPEAPEKEGYTFDGWTGIPETMPATDVTVTGKYTVNSYKLTFTIDGQTISEAEVEYGSAVTSPEAPEKEGYTFDGWTGIPETMPANDVIVTGKYTVNSYTVTYMIDDEVLCEVEVEYGTKLPESPVAPVKEGYEFIGWSDVPETMPAGNIIIEGKYGILTGINVAINENDIVDVYTIDGRLVKAQTTLSEVKNILKKGVYIINNKKYIIR